MSIASSYGSASLLLRNLQALDWESEVRLERLSSGLKIIDASDGPSVWAAASNLRSDVRSLVDVRTTLQFSQIELDAATMRFAKARELLEDMRSKITAASPAGSDRAALQSDIAGIRTQLTAIAGAGGTGADWMTADLSGPVATRTLVASYGSDGGGGLSVAFREFDLADLALYDTTSADRGILEELRPLRDASGRDLALGGLANEAGNRLDGGLRADAVAGTLVAATLDSDGGIDSVAEVPISQAVARGDGVTPGSVTMGILSYDRLKEGDVLAFRVSTQIGSSFAIREFGVTYSASTSPNTFSNDASLGDRLAAFDDGFVMSSVANGQISFTTTTASPGDVVRLEDMQIFDTSGIRRSRAAVGFNLPTGPTNFNVGRPNQLVIETPDLIGLEADDKIQLKIRINDALTTVRVTGANNVPDFLRALNADPAFRARAEADLDFDPTRLVISASAADWSGSGVRLEEVSVFDAAGRAKIAVGTGFKNVADVARLTFDPFVGPIMLNGDDSIGFDLAVDDAAAKFVRIDRAMVDQILGASDPTRASGVIAKVEDYAAVLRAALRQAGVNGIAVSTDADKIVFTGTARVGSDASIQISGITVSTRGRMMAVDRIDVSDAALAALGAVTQNQVAAVLFGYDRVVEAALQRVAAAEIKLATASRSIGSQSNFLLAIEDINQQAISRLVDADMSEETSRLRALQVRQQLAIQALSIANQVSTNILRLFR